MFQCADGTCRNREANCGQKQEYVNRFEYETTTVSQATSSSKPSDSNIYFGEPAVYGGQKGFKARSKCAEYSQRYRDFCRSSETINNQKYLTGSREAIQGEFSHLALLGVGTDSANDKWLSIGSIISEKFILTTYEAVYPSREYDSVAFAAVGVFTVTDPHKDGKIYRIKEKIRHTEAKRNQAIALLETETEMIFDKTVLPICLDTGDSDTSKGMIAGWGIIDRKKNHSLLVLSMTEQTESTCKSYYGPSRRLRDGYNHTTLMCYSTTESIEEPCAGDGGGPLLAVDSNCLYTVLGLETLGKGRCTKIQPDLLNRISHFVSWIENIVW